MSRVAGGCRAGRESYLRGHIPGARFADLLRELSGPIEAGRTGRHPLPEVERFANRLRAWGVKQTSQVVAYDDAGGAFAARLWWMLRWLGHERVARRAQYADLHLQAHRAGRKLSELPPDADTLTREVTKVLRQPGIECVAIVGAIAAGEPPRLAGQRAKNVHDLLGAHGVSLARLLTIGATAKVFGNGSRPAEPIRLSGSRRPA